MTPTGRRPLYDRLRAGPMFTRWHWLRWNFQPHPVETPFAVTTLDALLRCDAAMPGYAHQMLARLETFGGNERDLNDYEQIRQWLGELLVVHHFVAHPWPTPARLRQEPVAAGSAMKPEITVETEGHVLGVEVKTPDLRAHSGLRNASDWQLLARMPGGKDILPGTVTLPRDNPVKDFLVSADAKFAGFRAADPSFRSVLVVVWDDHVNEPISALLSPASGLLTPNSFHRNPDGTRRGYPNVDAVVLLRHQHQFVNGMANRPPVDDRANFLDYGRPDAFPPNALIACADGRPLAQALQDALQAAPVEQLIGAEYRPGEYVMWL